MGIYGSIASPPPLKASDKQGLVLYMGDVQDPGSRAHRVDRRA